MPRGVPPAAVKRGGGEPWPQVTANEAGGCEYASAEDVGTQDRKPASTNAAYLGGRLGLLGSCVVSSECHSRREGDGAGAGHLQEAGAAGPVGEAGGVTCD